MAKFAVILATYMDLIPRVSL